MNITSTPSTGPSIIGMNPDDAKIANELRNRITENIIAKNPARQPIEEYRDFLFTAQLRMDLESPRPASALSLSAGFPLQPHHLAAEDRQETAPDYAAPQAVNLASTGPAHTVEGQLEALNQSVIYLGNVRSALESRLSAVRNHGPSKASGEDSEALPWVGSEIGCRVQGIRKVIDDECLRLEALLNEIRL